MTTLRHSRAQGGGNAKQVSLDDTSPVIPVRRVGAMAIGSSSNDNAPSFPCAGGGNGADGGGIRGRMGRGCRRIAEVPGVPTMQGAVKAVGIAGRAWAWDRPGGAGGGGGDDCQAVGVIGWKPGGDCRALPGGGDPGGIG